MTDLLDDLLVHNLFVTEEEKQKILAEEVQEMPARGGKLKRAPKVEFYLGEEPIWYYYRQHKTALTLQKPMPQWMIDIGNRLPGKPSFNHAIIIRYSDASKHHAPPHRDFSEDRGCKTACIRKGTGFSVISVGEPRHFQLLDGPKGQVVWDEPLPDKSLLCVSAELNTQFWHAVPLDKSHSGVRCSLIFRDILLSSEGSATKKRKAED